MAEYWKIEGDELQDLAMCALLHDNALTQYISEELKKDSVINCNTWQYAYVEETHQVLAKRNFVLAVRGGIFGDKPTAYYDFGE